MKKFMLSLIVALSLITVGCSENPAEVNVTTTQAESEWTNVKWVGHVFLGTSTGTIENMYKLNDIADTVLVVGKNNVTYKCTASSSTTTAKCKNIKIKVFTDVSINGIAVRYTIYGSNVETIYRYDNNKTIYWETY